MGKDSGPLPGDEFHEPRVHADHQPASPRDLERFPPSSAECARVRGLLRDFVDDDLPAVAKQRIEAHVHGCRACNLALSRCESELQQIRAALAECDRRRLAPPASFAPGLMERISTEAAMHASYEPPTGFTRRVMDRVARETTGGPQVIHRPWRVLPRIGVAAAAAVLTVVGAALWWHWTQPEESAGDVVAARQVRLVGGAAVAAGQRLRGDEELATGVEGKLAIRLRGSRRGAGTVQLDAEGSVRLTDDGLELLTGDAEVTVEASMLVRVAEAGTVRLGPGQFEISSVAVRHQDGRAGRRVQVAVTDGTAEVVLGEDSQEVSSGQVAYYSSFGGLRVGRYGGRDLVYSSRAAAQQPTTPTTPAAPTPEPFGQLLDPFTSEPIAGASVMLRTMHGVQRHTTDAEGRFAFDGVEQLQGQFAVLQAWPPAGAVNLAEVAPTPLYLGGQEQGLRRFFFGRGMQLQGRLLDAEQRIPSRAWVQACRIDELFGFAAPLGGRVPSLDGGGAFRIAGLPIYSGPYQTLVLLAAQDGVRPRVVLARDRGPRSADAALELRLPQAQRVTLTGFPASTTLQFLMPIEDLPPGQAVWITELRSSAEGSLTLDLSGPTFLLDAAAAPRLVSGEPGGAVRLSVAALPPQLVGVRSGLLQPERLHWFGARSAFDAVAPLPAHGGLISVVKPGAQLCLDSSVFHRLPSGEVRFLGLFDNRVTLRCVADAVGELIAVTPDGWVGRLDLQHRLGRAELTIVPVAPGHLQAVPSTPQTGLLSLIRHDMAIAVPIHRDFADRDWVVLPGQYRFGAHGFQVGSVVHTDLPRLR